MIKLRSGSEPTAWLAFELLLPSPRFSARCVCAFKFIAFVHPVRSTGVIILGHAKAPRRVHSRTRHARILAEVSDSIFALPALQCRHEPCNRIRAACRAEHAVLGMVVDGLTDLEFMQHLTGHRPPRSPAQARLAAGDGR